MTYWRDGEYVYFHGAARGRFARACQTGDVALSVTIMDGLVLGHSPINHSANYRSVVVHGRPEIIESRVEKEVSMRSFFAKTIPGRWEALRAVRDEELDAMSVFRLRLEQVAAKIRNEFPDDEDHMPSVPVWTGILPSHQTFGSPVADERFPALPLPEYLDAFVGKAPFASRVDKC
jgi:nitroimidazol reductase NimA-like FMN-containing flavoprotein (pyridoxamine 5'-phosphate oxidase superfamily)